MSGRSDPCSLIEACPNLTGNVQLVKTDFVSCDVFLRTKYNWFPCVICCLIGGSLVCQDSLVPLRIVHSKDLIRINRRMRTPFPELRSVRGKQYVCEHVVTNQI